MLLKLREVILGKITKIRIRKEVKIRGKIQIKIIPKEKGIGRFFRKLKYRIRIRISLMEKEVKIKERIRIRTIKKEVTKIRRVNLMVRKALLLLKVQITMAPVTYVTKLAIGVESVLTSLRGIIIFLGL